MSLPISLPVARSRWRLTAIVAVVALIVSMLSLTAGQQTLARAEDGSTRTISGVVTLPEGSSASFAEVSVQATTDGGSESTESVKVAEDGSYTISDLEPGAYRVDFVVSGDSAATVDGQAYGATTDAPEGEVVDVAAESRDGIDVTLAAVVTVLPDEDAAPGNEVAAVEAEGSESSAGPDEGAGKRVRPEAELLNATDLNVRSGNSVRFGTVPDDSSTPPAAVSMKAPVTAAPVAPAAVSGTRSISGKISIAAGNLSNADLYLENVEGTGTPSRWLNNRDTRIPAAQRDVLNTTTGAYTFKNLAPGRYRINFAYDAASPVLVEQWYPNRLSRDGAVAIDVRQANVTGIDGSLKQGVALVGKLSVPSAFDKDGAGLYAVDSKGQYWGMYWNRKTGEYGSSAMTSGSYWLQVVSYNIKTGSMQFLKSGTQTKFTPNTGTTLVRNVTGINPSSKIVGKIAVTGGLPTDFERAANVYQKMDGVWFPLYYAYQNNGGNYLAVKLGAGQYSVEFSAKTGRDIAKGEWWNKKSSQATANLINLNGSGSVTGINGALTVGSSGQVSPFKDVLSSHKFYKEIRWMYTSGASTGTRVGSVRYYNPKSSVSREAMAAFMFRMNAPKNYKASTKSPFLDVPTNHKFYREIAWMYTSGLSTGNKVAGGRAYKPKEAVSRSAMAAFMYRQYAPSGKKYYAYFADVSSKHKFYNEISWMKDSGISTGTRMNGTSYYLPNDAVSREAMAAFLFRNALYR